MCTTIFLRPVVSSSMPWNYSISPFVLQAYTVVCYHDAKSACAQESHKHLDEYAELEAEILRDMEQEQAHRNCRRRLAVSVFSTRQVACTERA